ncbi:helix-turn-helix domain-containing protein [Actinomadura sp. DC4]|uniref:IclR family transcriptional regulator n=1 Tax=Actinomadura sp. DC4 TaxID=3055069 RepID=UPI0025B07ADF|nr:helix-turn-helix domain-containing protein [Actinomadura sp. DC4]MDN3359377.1 helix-turn-helix domain-containing protein [Actinomadura sp. DC4]
MTADEIPGARRGNGAGAAESTAELLVPAVTRTTRVLEALVRRPNGASLTELAEQCSLAKSTASNLLRTMVAEGLISYDPQTRFYNLGPLLVEFGVAAVTRTTAVTEARPFMERLAEQTGLACLAIQRMPDGHFTAIAKIESRKEIKVTIGMGARFDSTSPLLSRLIKAWAGESAGPDAEQLERIREQGHWAVFGEYRPELNVVGFPVFDRDAQPSLVITLLGIGQDLTVDDVERMSGFLVEAANAITTRSGGIAPPGYPTAGRPEGLAG